MSSGIRFIENVLKHPVDKDAAAAQLEDTRKLFTKSIVAVAEIHAGSTIPASALSLRKPGTGIAAAELANIIGKTATRNIQEGEFLAWEDFR